MDELRRAMLDAGAPPDEWQAELPFLIEAGQKRVRRRRMIATGVAAAVVTVIGTTAALAGVPGLNKSEPDPAKDEHSGVHVEEVLAPAELDSRCDALIEKARGIRGTWVAGVDRNGIAVPAAESAQPVEKRAGRDVDLALAGTDLDGAPDDGHSGGSFALDPEKSSTCVIPQSSAADGAGGKPSRVPAADDPEAIAQQCSEVGGFDLLGWQMLAAARISTRVNAVFRSTNGYVANCEITAGHAAVTTDGKRVADDDGRPILPADDTGPRDPDRYRAIGMNCRPQSVGPHLCAVFGVLPGLPDGYRVRVVLPDGSTVESATVAGGYAVAFEGLDGLLVQEGNGGGSVSFGPQIMIRVLDADGEVFWSGRKQ